MTRKETTVKDFEEVFERNITGFGNSSHIILPKEHAGERAFISIDHNWKYFKEVKMKSTSGRLNGEYSLYKCSYCKTIMKKKK